MSFALSKWLSLLLFPLSQVLILLLLALFALWWGRQRLGKVLLSAGLLWLYLCSITPVADFLMGQLEQPYPPSAAQDLPQAAAIVVLGGSTRGDTAAGQPADLNGQADRLVYAAQLHHLGKAPLLVVSGGSAGHVRSEAEEMAEILAIMGVPPRAIVLEEHSRTTYENALYTAQLLRHRHIDRVLLVTSAFHMARAEGVFVRQGVEVIPAATDYQLLRHARLLPPLLPSVSALQRTTYALREMAGYIVYRVRGYL